MKNRIDKQIPPERDYVIKRIRVTQATKDAIVALARDRGITQRAAVVEAFTEAFGTKRKLNRAVKWLRNNARERGPFTAIVELPLGKAVAS
jgi:hypothetical protein